MSARVAAPGCVAINARAAVREEVGGVERWARELAERLPALRPRRYGVLSPPPRLAYRAGHGWEQVVLPLAARRAAFLLCPANLAPLASGHTVVVVVHDAAPLRRPDWFGRGYARWQQFLLPRIARRARMVVVPTRFVADELRALIGVPETRLRVIAPGAGGGAAARSNGDLVRTTLGLTSPYVLAVGTDSERKNFGALDAIAPRLARAGLEVVIAGSTRSYLRGTLSVGARRLGYVPENVLPALYANAAALAMPSLYEGFGLPCIEAMAAGTPVVAARRTALPEVCGDAAILVDPDDHSGFASALEQAAFDSDTRARLSAAGRAHAARFNWATTAETIDRLFDELLD